MNLKEIPAFGLLCALVLAVTLPVQAKPDTTDHDTEVQMLANFPALQRLGAKGDTHAIREFLAHVSAAYRTAGYNAFGGALQSSAALISLFGEPERAEKASTLKQARTTVRRLESTLAKNPRIVLPGKTGDRIPNYYAIGSAFIRNADSAIKNLGAGRNVANTLRKKTGSLWVTNETGTTFILTGTGAYSGDVLNGDGSYSSGSLNFMGAGLSVSTGLLKAGPGQLILDGISTYMGTTTITNGTLGLGGGVTLGEIAFIGTGGTLSVTSGTWAIFPTGTLIPSDFSTSSPTTFSTATLINGVEYPAGTRIICMSDPSANLPDGASPLDIPATITGVPTPTPSPTPAE